MKKCLIILGMLCLQLFASGQTTVFSIPTNSNYIPYWSAKDTILNNPTWGDWVLIYHDEFNGNSIDSTKWLNYYPKGQNDFSYYDMSRFHDTSKTQQVYLDENVEVSNGSCKLIQKEESTTWNGITMPYSAGMLHSKKNFLTYSKYEIRAKLPRGAGLWTAFWLFGWSTEIDGFEINAAEPNKLYTTIHHWYTPNYSEWIQQISQESTLGYHAYTIEFMPHTTIFRIDGIVVATFYQYYNIFGHGVTELRQGHHYYRSIQYPSVQSVHAHKPWTDPLNLILGTGISRASHLDAQGNPLLNKYGNPENVFGMTAPDANTVFPNTYEIDYIRVYQRRYNLESQWVHNLNNPPFFQGDKNICGTGPVTLQVYNPSEEPLTYTSSSNLTIVASTASTVTIMRNGLGSAWIEASRAANHPIVASVGRADIWIGRPQSVDVSGPPFGCTMGLVSASFLGDATDYQWIINGGQTVGATHQSDIWVDPSNSNNGFTANVRARNICSWSPWYTQFFPVNCRENGGPTPLRVTPHGSTLDVDLSAYKGRIRATYLLNVATSELVELDIYDSISGIDIGNFEPSIYIFIVETTDGERAVSEKFVYH